MLGFADGCDVLVRLGCDIAHVLASLNVIKHYRPDSRAHHYRLYLLNILQTSNTHILLNTYRPNNLKRLLSLPCYLDFVINPTTDKNINTGVVLGRYQMSYLTIVLC